MGLDGACCGMVSMNSAPAVSIVMPLYNKGAQVLATVASVQAQTVSHWELVVVDDGSTDDGAALLQALADPRIRVHRQPNAGVSAARNQGIELARAELIAFLDADDLWQPGFLACILALHADFPAACWYATAYEIRPAQGGGYTSRLRGVSPDFQRGLLPNYFEVAARSDPPVCSSATAVQRAAILAIGGFPIGIGSGEDLLTWARLAVRFTLAYELRPLAVFMMSGIERRPDPLNRVGTALESLLAAHPQAPGLKQYLALWYRMQAVMAMRFKQTGLARRRAKRSFFHGPWQWRNGYTLLLAWLPGFLRRHLDHFLRRLA